MDSYEVLGLRPDASFADVKAAYIKLAKKHHPDKLQNVNVEELKAHEEMFRRVTMAYRQIEGEHKSSESPEIDWKTIFKRVVKDVMSNIHRISVPVTLEEVHNKKTKKLEVFLKSSSTPVYVRVSCGDFPKTLVTHGTHIIRVNFSLQDHKVFQLDDILGTHDLYTKLRITWADYLQGTEVSLIWCDGITIIPVVVKPFSEVDVPMAYYNKGLWGQGVLYISIDIVPPTEHQWNNIDPAHREKILGGLNEAHLSLSEDPKTI
jgi:DnaJ-class molecular chaperone